MERHPVADAAGLDARRPRTRVLFAGMVALAVAMGVGRFAFTPLLPLMLRDGTLTVERGAEWAAANYVGYLLGALTAARVAGEPLRGLAIALFGVAFSTIAVGLIDGSQTHLWGIGLRAVAGVFSAWALVCAGAFCLAELARLGTPRLGAWMFCGVGAGIAISGAFGWLGGQQSARWLWIELGVLGLVGAILVQRLIGSGARRASAPPDARAAQSGRARRATGLVVCYGVLGFGYIVPATFLPAMAREQVADPIVFGLTWPLFGLAAMGSVAAAARWLPTRPRAQVWAVAQGALSVGTALPLLTTALWALATSAVLVGGTFMVATMASLELARECAPDNPTPLLGRMTVAFAAGQIAGPLLVRGMGQAAPFGWNALDCANGLAAVLLIATAAWLAVRGARVSV